GPGPCGPKEGGDQNEGCLVSFTTIPMPEAKTEISLDIGSPSFLFVDVKQECRRSTPKRKGPASFLLLEDVDARQGLAFHPFEEGAAGGRDIGEIVRDAGMVEGGDCIAAAGDGNELAFLRARGGMLCSRHRRGVEGRDLEGAERAVPHERRRARD